MAALEFLKNRIVILMKERDKAINRADELQDTVQQATELVTKVHVIVLKNHSYCSLRQKRNHVLS